MKRFSTLRLRCSIENTSFITLNFWSRQMKRELIFFRLFLLISLISIFCFGAFSGYCFSKTSEYHQNAMFWYDMMDPESQAMLGMTRAGNPSPLQEQCEERWDLAVKYRDKYYHRAWLFLHLAYILPIISMFCFYSVRWVILGRLRPLWPKEI